MGRVFRSAVAAEEIVKQPDESLLFSMEFTKLLCAGELLDSVVSVVDQATNTVPINFQFPAVIRTSVDAAGNTRSFVDIRIAGGADGQNHRVHIAVTTNSGNTRSGDGPLFVREK